MEAAKVKQVLDLHYNDSAVIKVSGLNASLSYQKKEGQQRNVSVALPTARLVVHRAAAIVALLILAGLGALILGGGTSALIAVGLLLAMPVAIGLMAIKADQAWPETLALRLERAVKGSKERYQHLEAYFQVWFLLSRWPALSKFKSPLALVDWVLGTSLVDKETNWAGWLIDEPLASVFELLKQAQTETSTKELGTQQLLDGLGSLIQANVRSLAEGYYRGRLASALVLLLGLSWVGLAGFMLLASLL
ncbi:MAG: hypothetical protein ACK5Y6_03960 [Pseudomonadota bacterium]